MISPNKEIRQLVRELERAGFEVTKKHNHIKVRNPIDGRQISIPSTPSGNGRQRQNMQMSLRQIGFKTEPVASRKKTKQKEESHDSR